MWDLYGNILVLLSVVYLVPQIIKMIKTKSVKDISEFFLWYILFVHFLWMIFNIHSLLDVGLETLPYFLNNFGRVCFSLITLFLYYKYKRKVDVLSDLKWV